MKSLITGLGLIVLLLGGLVVHQGRDLLSLQERVEALEGRTASVPDEGFRSVAAARAPLATADVPSMSVSALGSGSRRPGTAVSPAAVNEVLAQPGARSQIAEIVREEQEEAEQQRWESRRQVRLEMLRDEADSWVADEAVDPAVGQAVGMLLEGWVDQRFDLRGAVMDGEMTHSEAREEGRVMRDELRAEALELVGEDAMSSLEERFPMLREDGGRPPGPPRF